MDVVKEDMNLVGVREDDRVTWRQMICFGEKEEEPDLERTVICLDWLGV